MAKTQSDSVYRVIDVVGVSETSWEDAGIKAVETAAGSLRDLRVAEGHQDGYESGRWEGHRVPHPRGALV
jgi:flavin-binding protein dodecin